MNHSRSILRTSPICFGATKNFTVLLSSVSGVLRIRSTNALEDCSYTATTSVNVAGALGILPNRSEEHTSELQSHGLISYAVFCLKKKKKQTFAHCTYQSSKAQVLFC